MKNYTQKRKELDKNGLKLSLICILNWFIGFVAKSQFYLFSALFCGLITYYLSEDIRLFTLIVLRTIVLFKVAADVINVALSREVKKIKPALLIVVMYLFFQLETVILSNMC